MAKYSFEFKKKIVLEYLAGSGGSDLLAKKYNVPQGKMVRNWITYYNELGDEGLRRSRKKETYSFELKLHVVELYLSSEVSYQELALSQGINNSTLLTRWVNDFRIAGPDALRPKKKGRKKTLGTKIKKDVPVENSDITDVGISIERVKQLEDELLRLRIENAYLKELRRLRLEEETLLKKQRESSTVSEENLN
jgi:transposase